jgi:hypothetical protein
VVLRDSDGVERDLTFLGAAGNPAAAQLRFDADIVSWLGSPDAGVDAPLVADPDASGGTAIDLTGGRAAG